MRCIAIAILWVTASAGSASAQAPGEAPPRFCFQGAQAPTCHGFMITEAGYAFRTSPKSPFSYSPGGVVLPSLELGAMRNLGDRVAVGGSIGAGLLGDVYLGIKPRVRLWLSRDLAADVSAGYLLNTSYAVKPVTGDVSIMYRDQLGITAQAFVVRSDTYPNGGAPTSEDCLKLFLGVRLGSKFGIGGAIGDATAFLAVLGAFIIACGNNGCD